MSDRPLMTIIIPAYNEAHRLPQTLPRVLRFIEQSAEPLSLIVVDNASTDETARIAAEMLEGRPYARLLSQPIPGKGAAVRKGMLEGDGRYLFICDADLAMPIEELPRFYPQNLGGDYDVAIASREAPGAHRYHEPWYRHLMGRVFNFIVRLLAVPGIHDTQCGFKAFRREVARDLFRVQRINGWAFDVEVLALARRRGYTILEVGIPWYYGEGSRVNPIADSVRMFAEVLRIRRAVRSGLYDEPTAPPAA
jgi:dolichyl-phosphate beta-glucosyltransferase